MRPGAVAGLILALAAATPLPAQDSGTRPGGFRYERPVLAEGPGAQRLEVDLSLLSGLDAVGDVGAGAGCRPSLASLRLFTAGGDEVPYLVVEPPPSRVERVQARVMAIAATKTTSGFEAELPASRVVERVTLEGLPEPFMKRARVEASGDRARWVLVADAVTFFAAPEQGTRRIDLAFPAGDYRYLRVTWDDSNSAVMPAPRTVWLDPAAERPVRESATSVAFERRAAETGRSRYRIDLPGPCLPVVGLAIDIGAGDVSREVRVLERRLVDGRLEPALLSRMWLQRAATPGAPAPVVRVPIRPPVGRQLELVVDDGNNQPLPLTGIAAVVRDPPWIYFESPGGGPLVARFGHPRLAAPRYDLEARRSTVAAAEPPWTRWGEPRRLEPLPEAGGAAPEMPGRGAPIERGDYQFSRDIAPGPAGLVVVPLDAAVLAHAAGPGFADVRVIDSGGAQVPYLLEQADEPLDLSLAIPARNESAALREAVKDGGDRRSRYEFTLPFEGLPPARLVLGTSSRVFERALAVMEPRADRSGRGGPYRTLETVTWRHQDPESPAESVSVATPAIDGARLWLAIDEGDNAPLALTDARLLLPNWRLRLFRKDGETLTVVYGRPRSERPRYDLALLRDRLIDRPAADAALGPERSAETGDMLQAQQARWIFWSALGLAVLVLFILIGVLLRKPGARSQEPGGQS